MEKVVKKKIIRNVVTAIVLFAIAIASFVVAYVQKSNLDKAPVYYGETEFTQVQGMTCTIKVEFINKTNEQVVIDSAEIRVYSKSGYLPYDKNDQIVIEPNGRYTITDTVDAIVNQGHSISEFTDVRPMSVTINGKKYKITNTEKGKFELSYIIITSVAGGIGLLLLILVIALAVKSKKQKPVIQKTATQSAPIQDVVIPAKKINVTEVIPHKDAKTGKKIAQTEFVKLSFTLSKARTIGKQDLKIKLRNRDENAVAIEGVGSNAVEIIDKKINKNYSSAVIIKRGETKKVTFTSDKRNGYFIIEVL